MPPYYDTAERRHKPSPFQGEGAPAGTLGRMRVRMSGASPGGPLIRHRLRRCHLPPCGGKATPIAAPREMGGSHHGPRTLAAPLRRQPREPPTSQYLHTSGSTNGGEASPDSHEPITSPPRIPRKKGVHRGQGAPAKPSFRLCGERRSKGANAVFAAGGNGVSGLCDDERALWLLSLAREKVTPPAGASPARGKES